MPLPADVMTAEQWKRTFPTATTLVGPCIREEALVYGKDITYPLPSPASEAASYVIKELNEKIGLSVVVQRGVSDAVSAKQEQVSKGNIYGPMLIAPHALDTYDLVAV